MASVYVIHHASDRRFVDETLLPLLPCMGFDRWAGGAGEPATMMKACDALLPVVSKAAAGSASLRLQVAEALRSQQPVFPIRLDPANPDDVAPGLSQRPLVENREEVTVSPPNRDQLWVSLTAHLGPIARSRNGSRGISRGLGQPIPWNSAVFSDVLQKSVGIFDQFGCENLVSNFVYCTGRNPDLYTPENAVQDLAVMRKKRLFAPMVRYASSVLRSYRKSPTVRRHYGHALLELRVFDEARTVLESIVADCEPGHPEAIEALGLLGRLFKQLYVNDPRADEAPERLQQALAFYSRAAGLDPGNGWPAVNYSSVMLRAQRDGFKADSELARQEARRVVGMLDVRWADKPPEAWELASYVEAQVALGQFEEADKALSDYLVHAGTNSFEVSSTYRQFVEVMQLDRDERGKRLVDRLWRVVDQHRSGGAFASMPESMSMLVRTSGQWWQPINVPEITIHSQLGDIVTIEGTVATVQALYRDSRVLAVQPSWPTEPMLECRQSLPYIKASNPYGEKGAEFEEKGDQALIAVIDNGIDILHHAFTDARGRSRIVGIWDQRAGEGPRPRGFSYGRHYTAAEIAGHVTARTVPDGLGRNADPAGKNAEIGHGTHVASIAAGRQVGKFAGGVAPEARLVVVIPHTSSSIGYSRSHVDALAFIEGTAKKHRLPVVVNVSQGMNAGAHDGSSPFEIAFDTFSENGTRQGRAVVKSAGNERDKNGHASVFVAPKGHTHLDWERLDNPRWPAERLELWWHPANEYEFCLQPPGGDRSEWVNLQRPILESTSFGMDLTASVQDNGQSRLAIRTGAPAHPSEAGKWTLHIHALTVRQPGPIHAWIERNGRLLSRFLNNVTADMTLTIPATAHSVIAVGAVEAGEFATVGDFSSYGPTRDTRWKPELSAPGIHIEAARSGTDDGDVAMDGTSMAAPHVTGAIALVMSRAKKSGGRMPVASQLTMALYQTSQNYTGVWDPGQGYGILDVAALLKKTW